MANYLLEALKRQKIQQMSHQPQQLPPDLLGMMANAEGKLYDRSMIYKSLKDAFTAPGRAYRGEIDALMDPRGAMEEAMNVAGMAQLGGIPGGARGPGSVGMIGKPKGWTGAETPVADGMVRLYRAESPTVKFDDVFNREGLESFASDKPGTRFTDDLKYADYFRKSYGKDATLQYVDVPRAMAESGRINDFEYRVEPSTFGRPTNAQGQPALSPSKVRALIDQNSPGESLNFNALRDAIGTSPYRMTRQRLDAISPDDLMVDASLARPEKGAIVIGSDGRIIDGRHRAAAAMQRGDQYIDAYIPAAGRPTNSQGQPIPPTRYELAHAEAQRVAALPVEQGGLGLPENNTGMDRARAMGFDTDFQHGSAKPSDIEAFDISKTQQSDAGYLGQGVYGGQIGMSAYTDGGVVYPLKTGKSGMYEHNMENWNAPDNPYSTVAERFGMNDLPEKKLIAQQYRKEMMDKGYSGIIDTATPDNSLAQVAIYDPTRIRSRFAAFNPQKRDSADLLASFGAPVASSALLSYLLGGSNDAEAGNLYDYLSRE